jgi:hypothetical protein
MSSVSFASVAVILCSLALATAPSAHAVPVLFDFEELSAGAFTTLQMTRPGYTITVSRTSGFAFEIANISITTPPPPAGWGQRTLSPFNYFYVNDGFLFDISAPVSSISIETADYGADFADGSTFDDIVSLTAYDSLGGTGNVLDSMTLNWGAQGPPAVAVLTTTAPFIKSIVALGGNTPFFPASMYWDNLRINPHNVPDVPGPLPVFAVGVAFGYSRKLRHRIKSLKA